MRVILVDNFFARRERGENVVEILPHLGLLSLAAVLEERGAAVRVADPKLAFADGGFREVGPDFEEAFAADLLRWRPDVVGFTAYGRSLPFAVKVAYALKRRRFDLPILLGGPHPTVLGGEILEAFACFDVVVRHEAEPTIVELCDAVVAGRELDDIPNLVRRTCNGVEATEERREYPDLDALPTPEFGHYPIARLRLDELPVEAGRGCPFPCTFCSTSAFFGRKYRLKSPERLVAELDAAHQRWGIRRFSLNHDLFGLHKPTVRAFCELVKPRGYTWKCSMRTDTIDPVLLAQMVESGCEYIYFGLETGSQRMQRELQKKLNVEEARGRIREVREAGAACATSFITGFPEETAEDQRATVRLAGEIFVEHGGEVDVQIHMLSPEPGSSLFARLGHLTKFDGQGPELGEALDHRLLEEHPRIFSVFRHFPTTLSREACVAAASLFSTIVPLLGAPVARHLVACVYGGRADALVEDIAAHLGGPHVDDALEGALLDALEAALAGRAAYARDLVAMVRLIDRAARSTPGADEPDEARAFAHDPLPALEHVIASPTETVPPERLAAPPATYGLARGPDERLAVVEVLADDEPLPEAAA